MLSVSLFGASRVPVVTNRFGRISVQPGDDSLIIPSRFSGSPASPRAAYRLVLAGAGYREGSPSHELCGLAATEAACVVSEYQEGHGLRTVGPETFLEKTSWLDVDTWALLTPHGARSVGSEARRTIENEGGSSRRSVRGAVSDGEDAEWILEEASGFTPFYPVGHDRWFVISGFVATTTMRFGSPVMVSASILTKRWFGLLTLLALD